MQDTSSRSETGVSKRGSNSITWSGSESSCGVTWRTELSVWDDSDSAKSDIRGCESTWGSSGDDTPSVETMSGVLAVATRAGGSWLGDKVLAAVVCVAALDTVAWSDWYGGGGVGVREGVRDCDVVRDCDGVGSHDLD